MLYKLISYAKASVVSSMLMSPTFAVQQPDTNPTRAEIVEVHTLLSRPGGLQILAKRRGHVVLDDQPDLFSDLSLATLIRASSEIAFVTILEKNSKLTSNGNNITTSYIFQPIEVFKGTFSKDETFSAPGGKVIFPNGASAEITTIEWRNLTVASQYILFLRESDNQYELTNGIEALFQISSSGAKLEPLPSFDKSQRPYAVLKEMSTQTPDSFKTFIRKQVAGKKRKNVCR